MNHRRLTGAFVVLLLVLLSSIGCRSSREVVVAPPEAIIKEEFDPTPYPDPPPVLAGDIVHVLPPQVIGEIIAPRRETTPRSVSGYRIQVGSYRDRTEANQSLQETIEWWNSIQEDAEPSTTPVFIEWEQPYWKIRIGNFRTRQEANRLLGDVRKKFEGAFVVPSAIEIR